MISMLQVFLARENGTRDRKASAKSVAGLAGKQTMRMVDGATRDKERNLDLTTSVVERVELLAHTFFIHRTTLVSG